MRPDPRPFDRVPVPFPHSPVLFVDSHRPDVFIPAELFETKGWVFRILGKQLIRPASRRFRTSVECCVSAPKAGSGFRRHSRSKSKGSDPSFFDSLRNASRLGRGAVEPTICSHRSSPSLASRNRAKSATSTRLAAGSCSQIWISSCVSVLMPGFYPLHGAIPIHSFVGRGNNERGSFEKNWTCPGFLFVPVFFFESGKRNPRGERRQRKGGWMTLS